MILFVVIALLIVITWYSIGIQFSSAGKKSSQVDNPLIVDKDTCVVGLEHIAIQNVFLQRLIDEISGSIKGEKAPLYTILTALLAQGHVLIQGAPGTGKTSLVKVFSTLSGLQYSRIQCTPDMLPQDVLGVEIYNKEHSDFILKPGPIFSQVVHVDEINRATPKLQSAFLEAMQEKQVTLGNTTQSLPDPFFVIATQNPYDSLGTYMLPYAQVDRFMVGVFTQQLSSQEQIQALKGFQSDTIDPSTSILGIQDIKHIQKEISTISTCDAILEYVVSVVDVVRKQGFDISIRTTQSILSFAKVVAYLQGKNTVEKQDVQMSILPTLRHRISYMVRTSVSDEQIYDIMIGSLQKDDIVS